MYKIGTRTMHRKTIKNVSFYSQKLLSNNSIQLLEYDCKFVLNRLINFRELQDLKSKYNKPEEFDKLTAANTKIEAIQVQLKDNINDLAVNQHNLGDLEDKANEVNMTAKDFQGKAGDLEKILWWRKVK